MDCDNCKYKICWEYAEPCSSCTNMTGVPTNWEPQTNADRIRAMTYEELAEWMCKTQFREGEFCPPKHGWNYCIMADGCRECWLGWLKSPAEVDT